MFSLRNFNLGIVLHSFSNSTSLAQIRIRQYTFGKITFDKSIVHRSLSRRTVCLCVRRVHRLYGSSTATKTRGFDVIDGTQSTDHLSSADGCSGIDEIGFEMRSAFLAEYTVGFICVYIPFTDCAPREFIVFNRFRAKRVGAILISIMASAIVLENFYLEKSVVLNGLVIFSILLEARYP